jgi:prepilin-type N-terminal cleavage/methylation domain-containing protein
MLRRDEYPGLSPLGPSQGANVAGFTLIEVLLALTLGSLVMLMAHRVFAGVTDGARRLSQTQEALDREANARRLLTAIVGSLDIGTPQSAGFDGRAQQVTFSTWAVSPDGWLVQRRVTLRMASRALVAEGLDPATLVLADSVAALDVDYLLDYGAEATWVRNWQSPVSAPLVLRMRIARARGVDTLLLVAGPRG